MRVHFVYIKYKGQTLFDEVAVEGTFGVRGSDRKKIILRAEKIWHAKKICLFRYVQSHLLTWEKLFLFRSFLDVY